MPQMGPMGWWNIFVSIVQLVCICGFMVGFFWGDGEGSVHNEMVAGVLILGW